MAQTSGNPVLPPTRPSARAAAAAQVRAPSPERPEPDGALTTELTIGAPVRWQEVAGIIRAWSAVAAPTDRGACDLESLVVGLTEPLRRLDRAASDVRGALGGDDHAAARVRAMVREISRLTSGTAVVGRLPAQSDEADDAWLRRAVPVAGARPATSRAGILDDQVMTSLLLGATAVADEAEQLATVDAILALALAAGALGSVAIAWDGGGPEGLVAQLETLAAAGLLGGSDARRAPVPLVVSDPLTGGPTLRPQRTIEDLLAQLRRRSRWQAGAPDRAFPWQAVDARAVDPRWYAQLRCFVTVARRLGMRTDPPPVRPGRAVWADGIDAVTTAPVDGDVVVTITGGGFGASQSHGVVLLLPTATGCHPAAPTSWTDTRITAVLPETAVSGPVGFADAAYVADHDQWSARRRAADAALAALPGVKVVPALTRRFGERPPNTPHSVVRVGRAEVTSFTANSATQLSLEPGTPLQLSWSVRNAETVAVERTSATGPLFAGIAKVVDPVGSTFSLGVPDYTARQVWTYRVTATGPSGGPSSRTVTVIAGKRPALRIEGVEVTQAIQTLPATVRLVESKPTVVRVTVRHGLDGFDTDAVPRVRGRMRVRDADIGTSPWFDAVNGSGTPMMATPGTSITVRARPARDITDDTLNFAIPPGWARGTHLYVDVEVRVEGYGAVDGFAGYDDRTAASVGPFTFEARRALRLRYIRVAWEEGAAPAPVLCASTLAGTIALLPTPTAGVAAVPGVHTQRVALAEGSDGRAERRALVDDWEDRRGSASLEPLFDLLGHGAPEDDGAIWVLVAAPPTCTAAGPGMVCLAPAGDSASAAQEIARCLNQRHVPVTSADLRSTTAGSTRHWSPGDPWARDGGPLRDVPFDVVRNTTLPGPHVVDLMSRGATCDRSWPTPERWHQLWDEIGT